MKTSVSCEKCVIEVYPPGSDCVTSIDKDECPLESGNTAEDLLAEL